jgi:hypothetical protein
MKEEETCRRQEERGGEEHAGRTWLEVGRWTEENMRREDGRREAGEEKGVTVP